MKKIKKIADKLAILLVSVFWILAATIGILQKFDLRVYDLLLSLKDDPKTRSEILLVDIDNPSLEAVGPWPWSRDVWANTLIRMKELGAKTAVFDIEFLSPSNLSARPDAQKAVATVFSSLGLFQEESDFFDAIQKAMYRDNDSLFASSIQFFGNAWLTVNTSNLDIDYSEDEISYAISRFSFLAEDEKNLIFAGNVKNALEQEEQTIFDRFKNFSALKKINWENPNDVAQFSKIENALSPAFYPFIQCASGAGFTNVFIDPDGSRRRVELLSKRHGSYFAQLSFAPLLSIIQPEKIVREKRELKLLGATIDGEKKDITIPLDNAGRMFVNWKHSLFQDSFRHASISFLSDLDRMEENIASLLNTLATFEWEGGTFLPYKAKAEHLSQEYETILRYKDYLLSQCAGFNADGTAISGGMNEEELSEYFAIRAEFFKEVFAFSEGSSFDEIGAFLQENLDYFQESAQELAAGFSEIFDTLNNECSVYNSASNRQKEAFSDSFCIIGNTASGTTDLGITPFERAYPNVGTHANVYNTIMTQDFIKIVDWWQPALISFVLSLLLIGFAPAKKAWIQAVIGIVFTLIVCIVPAFFMKTRGIYIPAVTPALIAISSYLVVTLIRFLSSEHDKRFITNAFSQCLSKEVVAQLIADPSSFKLGGEKREMTAMFTDIQKFSSFSELLSATQLVALLNYYLTKMSDIIMDESGTVDKYEGDAIVALVGAPLKMEGGAHAVHACAAALKMKKTETLMNEEIVRVASQEKPETMSDDLYEAFQILVNNKKTLFTRIGLNSGEMTAGYMGSENKKNYTMMGNNVNLASRLEGVNKQYSTGGILISEHTEKLLGDRFLVRPLDRVRVVNVKTPLRLYELISEKSEASEEDISYMKDWRIALKKFEQRDYDSALLDFQSLLERRANDGVARYYARLTEDFFAKGKFPTDKDDVGVAFDETDGVFTLLQK